jgi:phosphoribosylamine--glycine ligase
MQLVTSGVYGWTLVVTGTGDTVADAKAAAYARAAAVRTPNVRYRSDIGDKVMSEEFKRLAEWGWLKSSAPDRIASQIVR